MSRDAKSPEERRLPVGAEVSAPGTHFRVWAPARSRVEVVPDPGERGSALSGTTTAAARGAGSRHGSVDGGDGIPLEPEGSGYFSGFVEGMAAGSLYRFRLDDEGLFPDPASRFQPSGPHGPSEVVDPRAFRWTDGDWRGLEPDAQALYELHVGTFTSEGSWRAAGARLPHLSEMGFTAVCLMPVADFHGRFGWGYDGVDFFAPTRLYGRPDDFRGFVDRAHGLGLGVLLDVVYNHVGTVGNYLSRFTPRWFSDRHESAWGEAFNFDGPDSRPVRDFFLANVEYWVREFHVDGFRFDAANEIHDESSPHMLVALARRARAAAPERRLFLMAENEAQEAMMARPPADGGYGLDAIWNEDFHHSVMVALTGRREAYFTDYRGSAQELVSLARWGFLYQGQRYRWQGKRRGTPAEDLPPRAFVAYLENHDQVANSPDGSRLHRRVAPGPLRAATAYLLLGPATPLLFQGQESAADAPFFYFADRPEELAASTREGRRKHLVQFRSLKAAGARAEPPDPTDPATFERSRLSEGSGDPGIRALHRDLLRLRREDATLRRGGRQRPEGAVLGPGCFLLRFRGGAGDDRLLLVNLGPELWLEVLPEPLLAPPPRRQWALRWSSEDPAYGGWGTAEPETPDGWRIPAGAALLLAAVTVP